MEFEEKVLVGAAALLTLLVVGAVFGRLHGKEDSSIQHLGDRVACGLFALPLISVCVHLAFPSAPIAWVLMAPLPLAVYVILLAGVDLGWKISRQYFTFALVSGVGVVYVAMAVGAWLW